MIVSGPVALVGSVTTDVIALAAGLLPVVGLVLAFFIGVRVAVRWIRNFSGVSNEELLEQGWNNGDYDEVKVRELDERLNPGTRLWQD